jgi:ubiquinol-cytochrome c reductase subunit 7
MFGPLSVSFAPYVKSSRTLFKWLKPIGTWYADAAGYRKYGFKYDDLRT